MKLRSTSAALLTLMGGSSTAALTYHVTDLGPGVSSSVNDSGQVVGYVDTAGDAAWHAFLYSGGVVTDLGTLGGSSSVALGVDASGQVAGWADTAGDSAYHAFLYAGGVMQELGTFGGTSSAAYGINGSGQVVGGAETPDHYGHAFLYSGGVMHDLGTLGGVGSSASGVDDSGRVVGSAAAAGGAQHAFLYSGGVMQDLGTLGGSRSWAQSLNDSGQIVGWAYTAGGVAHACSFSGTAVTDLGTLGGGWSQACCVNGSGQVVGWSDTAGDATHAFLYFGGALTDLNGLLDAGGAGYVVVGANGIADNGMIAAYGPLGGGDYHALLLTPNAGVSGTVTLQDFAGDVTRLPVAIEIRNPGTTTAVQRQTVYLNAAGAFSFCSALKGTYDVAAKASHWLRKKISNVTLPGDAYVSGVNFSLVNGDVNGDNTINLADAVAISRAWRTKPGDPKYNPNADLNGDGSINLADAVIVSKNWRKTGDP